MKKIYLFIAAFVFLGFHLSAQNNGGTIKITLTDKNTKESIPFANVVVYNGKVQVAVGTTDMEGDVTIRALTPGNYNVKAVYVGYQGQQINDVEVNNDKTTYLKIPMTSGIEIGPITVTEYSVPIINPETTSGGTIDQKTFQAMAA